MTDSKKKSAAITVVIPTYNRSEKVLQLLEDIDRQTVMPAEVILVDDGSSENHLAKYRQLASLFEYELIFLEKQGDDKSMGPAAGRNRGLRLAKGDFVTFVDDDDRLVREDHLEVGVISLKETGGALFFADMQFSAHNQVVNPSMYGFAKSLKLTPLRESTYRIDKSQVYSLLRHRILHCDSLIISRAFCLEVGGYREELRYAEDHEFCFRLIDRMNLAVFRDVVCASLDVSPHTSIARSYDAAVRLLYGQMALQYAESYLIDGALMKVARSNRSWKIRELSELMASRNRKGAGWHLSLESFCVAPSKGGLLHLIRISFNVIFGK